jgi:mitotic spindle assembly checkpoint protein MAD2
MASSKQAARQAITLKGSTNLVTEFFKYAVNTYAGPNLSEKDATMLTHVLCSPRILFQREVYPSDDFHMVKKYGQTVLVTQDLALENYLERWVCCVLIPKTLPDILSLLTPEFSHK